MKYLLFAYLGGFIFLFLSRPAFSIDHIDNIASVSSEIITIKSGISPNITPMIKPIESIDNSSSQTIATIPTVKDSNIAIPPIQSTIIPIDKKKKPPDGLLVKAPNNLIFQEKSVSSSDQWVQMNPDANNPITIIDQHEGNGQWGLTISATDFSDKDDFIPVSNLSLWVDTLVAREGSTQNIRYQKNIQFYKPGEGYQLVSKDFSSDKGVYDLTFGLKLHIPANSSAGKYQTELVLTII